MTLGSLFDGSGGFPLAGVMNGMTPVWASEIEPYPLKVTAARFPCMKQLGDVTKIDGSSIDPVDVITFGSPCQDLSVAGKQTGIHDGKRSSLFFEAVRIIRELRGITNGKYPRFAVWENVPDAFSSNKGADFCAVLQALCEIADPDAAVPEPPKGKWAKAGCVVGDGYSLAWRVYDAQYWGVPQRRKRIYLVADFGSERAGEILFEREGVRGDSAQGREAREGTADDAAGGTGGGYYAFHLQQDHIGGSVSPCIGGQHYATVGAFMGGQGEKAGGIGYSEQVSPTLKSVLSGGNTVPDVVYQNTGVGWWNESHVAETLRTPCGGDSTKANIVAYDCRGNGSGGYCPKSDRRSRNRVTAICLQGNGIDRADTARCNGCGWRLGKAYTINTIDRHAVCVDRGQNVVTLDCRNMVGNEGISGTLQAKNEGGYSLNFVNPVVYDQQRIGQYGQTGTASTLMARLHKSAADVVVEKDRRYIVRRLTPLECCRLQGFPDWWEDGANGSDSARYKMWGNGIALPCAADVMRRIAEECKICTPLHNTALDLHGRRTYGNETTCD